MYISSSNIPGGIRLLENNEMMLKKQMAVKTSMMKTSTRIPQHARFRAQTRDLATRATTTDRAVSTIFLEPKLTRANGRVQIGIAPPRTKIAHSRSPTHMENKELRSHRSTMKSKMKYLDVTTILHETTKIKQSTNLKAKLDSQVISMSSSRQHVR